MKNGFQLKQSFHDVFVFQTASSMVWQTQILTSYYYLGLLCSIPGTPETNSHWRKIHADQFRDLDMELKLFLF